MDAIPRSDFLPPSSHIRLNHRTIPRCNQQRLRVLSCIRGNSLFYQLDDPIASLSRDESTIDEGSNEKRSKICSHLLGSLTSKNRGGFTAGLWIMGGAFLALGTRSPELALFNRAKLDYSDSKGLPELDAEVACMQNSRSGRFFVAGDGVGSIQFCNPDTSKLGSISAMPGTYITSMSTSIGDSKMAVTGAHGSSVGIWDVGSLREEIGLTVKGYDPYMTEWHPTWSLIATGSRSQHVNLHDPRYSLPSRYWIGHRGSLSALKWLPGKEFNLFSAGRDGICRIWDIRALPTNANTAGLASSAIDSSPTAFNDTERSLVGFLAGTGNIELGKSDMENLYVTTAAINPKANNILTLGDNFGGIAHWNINDVLSGSLTSASKHSKMCDDKKPLVHIAKTHAFSVTSLAYDDSGKCLASAGGDAACRVFGPAPPGAVKRQFGKVVSDPAGEEELSALNTQLNQGMLDIDRGVYMKPPIKCVWSSNNNKDKVIG